MPKSNENRKVRSIRLTDSAWDKLGEMALSKNLTRADFLEEVLVSENLSVISSQLTELNLSDFILSEIDKAASLRCITRNEFIETLIEESISSDIFKQRIKLAGQTQMNITNLSKVLGADRKTIKSYKDGNRSESLVEWSRSKSPDGKAWDYDPGSKLYFQVD
ncbi:MAG: hypothetical protein F6K47_30495 [Symploca sp. SIO2E6]|nr:hypothetical protein [Symploca sp. SIO2E6]